MAIDKTLSEEDVKNRYITPALNDAGWDKMHMRLEYAYTAGQIVVQGAMRHRKKRKIADYVLYDEENYPIAVVEAKSAAHTHYDGLQQAMDYASDLDIPFAFSTNGEKFRMYSKCIPELEKDLEMTDFPSPDELHRLFSEYKKYTPEEEALIHQPYYSRSDSYPPRYYQRIAINRTIEAVAKGQDRILLVMATGTGKTYTAFQIIHRLMESGKMKRILYLADRNILIDQSIAQDFKPFSKVIHKIKSKNIPNGYKLYMALYGQLVKYPEEMKPGEKQPYEELAPDFFDLVVVDECHRSSVRDDSQWKNILKYFSSATHIGLTATPRDAKNGSNFDDFGQPVYTYSLWQGIQDGFLAPYRVTKSFLSSDLEGYIPLEGEKDLFDKEIESPIFTRTSFGREINISNRQIVVARRITEMLNQIGKMTKTIVFCPDEEEANIMRELLIKMNQVEYRKNPKYIVRITASDRVGKSLLDSFIDPYEPYPVIATTSMLLSTGVDCKTCGLIVIDKEVNSMTTFKQMIGRGTRIHEKTGKMSFDILDFRDATNLFFDPDFDGPADTHPFTEGKKPSPPEPPTPPAHPKVKYYVEGDDVAMVHEQIMHIGADGKMMTEKLTDLTRKAVQSKYPSLDMFRGAWAGADKKAAILDELNDNDVWIDALRTEYPHMKDMDEFDIICHIAFDGKPLTRRERVENVKKRNCFAKYGEEARRIIDALLDKYAETGVVNIEDTKILEINPFSQYGRKAKIMKLFNGLKGYNEAINEIEEQLYMEG